MHDLHHLLDQDYSPDRLQALLAERIDLEERFGPFEETPLHVAARRYRCDAVAALLDAGAKIDARTRGGKTAYAHSIRRSFDDLAALLQGRDASVTLNPADRLAVALTHHRLDEARDLLLESPEVVRTGNPEEDRLLADLAGRMETEPVVFLLEAGADLATPALDDGTPLHQAAWFGSPENARLLVEAGAPLDAWDSVHESTPLGWAVHGSRYSGGAESRQDVYVSIVKLLLQAGATLTYPASHGGDGESAMGATGGGAYLQRLREDASPDVLLVLPES